MSPLDAQCKSNLNQGIHGGRHGRGCPARCDRAGCIPGVAKTLARESGNSGGGRETQRSRSATTRGADAAARVVAATTGKAADAIDEVVDDRHSKGQSDSHEGAGHDACQT